MRRDKDGGRRLVSPFRIGRAAPPRFGRSPDRHTYNTMVFVFARSVPFAGVSTFLSESQLI
jgi:hypothetical protein